MIESHSRSDIFRKSAFVDNRIAQAQQAIYRAINQDDPEEIAHMIPFLDHLQPIHSQPQELDEFCVLAYAAATKESYVNQFPLVLVDFFTQLNIEELYILTECKNDWKDFVFENDQKRKAVLEMLGHQTGDTGLRVEIQDLHEILPLFFFTHPDHPHINLVPPGGDIPIDMFLCKDGNLHTLYGAENYEQLKAAAEFAGLVMGSFEVCRVCRNSQL